MYAVNIDLDPVVEAIQPTAKEENLLVIKALQQRPFLQKNTKNKNK